METDKIYNEDCIRGLKGLPDNSVNLIIADPPYGVSNKGKFEIPEKNYYRVNESWDIDVDKLTKSFIKESYRVLKDGGAIYITASFHNLRLCWDALEKEGFTFRNNLIFAKTNAMPIKFAKQIGVYAYSHEYALYFTKGKTKTFNYEKLKRINGDNQCRDFVIITMNDRASNKGKHKHPTMKPLELIKLFVMASSNEGDIVLDPFMGSGTTAIACKQLDRKYVGFEIDPEYYKYATDRLKQGTMTGFFKTKSSNEDFPTERIISVKREILEISPNPKSEILDFV